MQVELADNLVLDVGPVAPNVGEIGNGGVGPYELPGLAARIRLREAAETPTSDHHCQEKYHS
jgi:hypothetical protein